jgi:hypothetical protein
VTTRQHGGGAPSSVVETFDLEAYARQGYAVLRGVLSPAVCEQARQESDRLMTLCGADRQGYGARLEAEIDHLAAEHRAGMDAVIRKIEPISDLSPFFDRLAQDEAVAGPARAVLGGVVNLFVDMVNL